MFYGILILMYFYDNKKHSAPHIHAEYGEYEATIAIEDGSVLGGQDEVGTGMDRNTPGRLDGGLEVGSFGGASVQN
jgi:hypothetical protein